MEDRKEDDEGSPDVLYSIFLAGVNMDSTGKNPPPCYQYAREGECSLANCKYSHLPSNVKAYQKLGKQKAFLNRDFLKVMRRCGGIG